MEIEDLISIGFIKKPFGNDGFVTVVPKSSFIEIFPSFTEFFVVWKNRKVRYKTVEKCHSHKNKIKIKFKDINSKKAAFELKKAEIMIAKEDLQSPYLDNYDHPKPIKGYKVFSCQNDTFFGSVKDTLFTAAHPILIISSPNDKEILIPLVDNFVTKIDDKKQKIFIKTIPGLIDAN